MDFSAQLSIGMRPRIFIGAARNGVQAGKQSRSDKDAVAMRS